MEFTTRKGIEIVVLALVCLASLRTFWKGEGFSPAKKVGLFLALVVFVAVSLLILRSGH